jgi:hypothetical protein
MNTVICLPKFRITNPVISKSLLRKIELLTEANSKLGLFQPLSSPSLRSSFSPCGSEAGFTNFPTIHHNLKSFRATPSHLGDFTFKSNKCNNDLFHKAQVIKCSDRGLSQTKLGFLTNHTNLTKRCWGYLTNA